MFNLDIEGIIRRNTPVILRRTVFLKWVFVLCSFLLRIHTYFYNTRAGIIWQYKFNGLIHSMEWMLNDVYDNVERRIHIYVPDHQSTLYLQGDGEIPETWLTGPGQQTEYYLLSAEEHNEAAQWTYEFVIWVHGSIDFEPSEMLKLVAKFRYAGLRPIIRLYFDEIPPNDDPVEYEWE